MVKITGSEKDYGHKRFSFFFSVCAERFHPIRFPTKGKGNDDDDEYAGLTTRDHRIRDYIHSYTPNGLYQINCYPLSPKNFPFEAIAFQFELLMSAPQFSTESANAHQQHSLSPAFNCQLDTV